MDIFYLSCVLISVFLISFITGFHFGKLRERNKIDTLDSMLAPTAIGTALVIAAFFLLLIEGPK